MAKDNPKPIDSSASMTYTYEKKGKQPPSGEIMEARVAALETKFDKIDGKLDRLLNEMATFKFDMARLDGRVSTIEGRTSVIDANVNALVLNVAEMKGRLETMPSGEAFGYLRGRVDSLPTTSKIASMLGIAVAIITIANNWQAVLAFFR